VVGPQVEASYSAFACSGVVGRGMSYWDACDCSHCVMGLSSVELFVFVRNRIILKNETFEHVR
jgi:hypothetical protein